MSYDGCNGMNADGMGMNGMNFQNMRVEKRDADRQVRFRIFCTSAVLCSGICGYVLFSALIGQVLSAFPMLRGRYLDSSMFGVFFDMLYSFFCVGLPFLAVLLFFRIFSDEAPDIRFGKVYNRTNAALLIVAGLGVCFLGNLADSMLIDWLGSLGMEFYSYREATSGADVPTDTLDFILTSVRTAVVPAFIEEFAFRGVVLGTLRKYGDAFAIGVSAALFGLMHGNFTQVPFAVIAGVALGFLCVVTGSVWPSVILHFCNNFISVVYSTAMAQMGGNSVLLSVTVTYGLIFIGAGALGIYLFRNKNGLRLRPSPYVSVRGKTLAFILSPTLILGAGALIKNMADDIVR